MLWDAQVTGHVVNAEHYANVRSTVLMQNT